MVIFVIIINLIITLLNFYLARRIWQFYLTLSDLTASLNSLEPKLHYFFIRAPIYLQNTTERSHILATRYNKLAQIINLLSQLWFLTRRFG
jgi:hypothetical protein